jgi:hypothetical protein
MAVQGAPVRGLRVAAVAVLVLFAFGLSLEMLGLVRTASTSTGEISAAVASDHLRTEAAVPVAPAPAPKPKRQTPTSTRKRFREPTVAVETDSHGIILCLHDRIIPLGVSLITELRCLGNRERIHIYHCLGELTAAHQEFIKSIDANVEIIDVCEKLLGQQVMDRKTIEAFRSYWLKPLALHQTTLDHVLMLDADALLLQDPATLRTSERYIQNGTLFFHDRVINDSMYFNRDVLSDEGTKMSYLHHFLETFDYERLGIPGGFQPSHHLLHSYAYSGRSAHEMDSSMVLVRKSAPGAALAMRVIWVLMTETRFDYEFSYGDKESFWLAYELAHARYAFSPWGATVLSSHTNRDMETHASTLCGSLAHFVPIADPSRAPQLLYVNGKALVDPVPFDVNDLKNLRANLLFNLLPTHMSPRRPRTPPIGEKDGDGNRRFFSECLTGLGATPTPPQLLDALWRRRMHFMAISMNRLAPLKSCAQ